MPKPITAPPFTPIDPVTEVLHGVRVTDPYRWLEDQDSPRTREWLHDQHNYARSYLDNVPGRERIRDRIRELVDVETYDSIQKVGPRYFFRKRQPGQEQPSIYFRDGRDGADQLLVDPAVRGTGSYTAVKPLRVSPDGRLLLYEIKEGGERTGTFEILDVESRAILPDALPRGYLRGFAFAPDSKSFYYAHECPEAGKLRNHSIYCHALGTSFDDDPQIFFAGTGQNIRLSIVTGSEQLGFLVFRFSKTTLTDFYLWEIKSDRKPEPILRAAEYHFAPLLLEDGRILAMTDLEAPNFRIVEVCPRVGREPVFRDIVAAKDATIQNWIVAGDRVFVEYTQGSNTEIDMVDPSGGRLGQLPVEATHTVRLVGAAQGGDEVLFETESFAKPIRIYGYCPLSKQVGFRFEQTAPTDSHEFRSVQIWFTARDGVSIPMSLVGRREVLYEGCHPTIMTSYGGFGVPMTPKFSVFVTFLIERGCLFAMPGIRGGSEFGTEWHDAAKRRNRQIAFDDFLAAAEWLIEARRTDRQKLAIFGGSNSGLLVGAAMTQRPDLFRAVVCMVPLLDMLRYHLFDDAHVWKQEFGTAEDPEDFLALCSYSPYHCVREGTPYPATMIVSGDCDQNCNPLHARKMTARLQAAGAPDCLSLLDYRRQRGHSPVLPLSARIDALTDRMAFLCDQLDLTT